MRSDTERLISFHAAQLRTWPAAAARYVELRNVRVREVTVDGFPVRLQFNPARAVSTGAKTDAASIAARPCFLCKANRPAEQSVLELFPGMDTLVNPFPIFSRHFTLACREHRHQDTVDFGRMAEVALSLPGLVTFYNGSAAGASAPDHLHLQAGEREFLPICEMLEGDSGQLVKSTSGFNLFIPENLPFRALHFVCTEASSGTDPEMMLWMDTLLPVEPATGQPLKGMRNVLMWPDREGCLHTLFLPRAAHRPSCYFKPEGDGRLMVSPGAVDMAGVIVLPCKEDFESVTRADIRRIYDEVSFPYMETEQFKRLLLL